jgi:hypothetical protein
LQEAVERVLGGDNVMCPKSKGKIWSVMMSPARKNHRAFAMWRMPRLKHCTMDIWEGRDTHLCPDLTTYHYNDHYFYLLLLFCIVTHIGIVDSYHYNIKIIVVIITLSILLLVLVLSLLLLSLLSLSIMITSR